MKISVTLVFLLLLASLLIVGCGNESIANRIRIMVAVGFDQEDDLYKGTILYPNYIKRKGALAVLKGVGKEPRLIMKQFERKSSRMVKYSKINSIIFSHEMANESMKTVVNTIISDPSLSSKVLLAVSSCSAEEIINNLDHKEIENSPYYIVEQNVRIGGMPQSNLHFFLHDLLSDGKDPSMPSIGLDEQSQIKVDGYALFKKDRLKLVLSINETLLYQVLTGGKVTGEFPFTYDENDYVLSINKSNLRRTADKGYKLFRFDVSLDGRVINYHGNNIAKEPSHAGKLTKAIEIQMKTSLHELLKKLQSNQLDSLGVGELFRSVDREWRAATFYRDIYPTLNFDVNVSINLKNSGSGE